MKRLMYLVLFLLMISFVIAGSVTTDKTEYSSSDSVKITSTCTGDSVLQVKNADGSLITVEQGSGSWQTTYKTASDPTKGKYTLTSFCESDGKTATKQICVSKPGCLSAGTTGTTGSTSGSTGSSGGGGGGGGCFAKYDTTVTWSLCNSTGQQTRTLPDISRCRRPAKVEVRDCTCTESWVCSSWSGDECGTRKCVDEHSCGTTLQKPIEQKSCPIGGGPFLQKPAQQDSYLVPDFIEETTFWQEWGDWIVGAIIVIILIIIGVVVALHFLHKKKVVYNHDELLQWIKDERAAGTSNADIIGILKQNTGWTNEEVSKAFSELQQNPNPTGATQPANVQ